MKIVDHAGRAGGKVVASTGVATSVAANIAGGTNPSEECGRDGCTLRADARVLAGGKAVVGDAGVAVVAVDDAVAVEVGLIAVRRAVADKGLWASRMARWSSHSGDAGRPATSGVGGREDLCRCMGASGGERVH